MPFGPEDQREPLVISLDELVERDRIVSRGHTGNHVPEPASLPLLGDVEDVGAELADDIWLERGGALPASRP